MTYVLSEHILLHICPGTKCLICSELSSWNFFRSIINSSPWLLGYDRKFSNMLFFVNLKLCPYWNHCESGPEDHLKNNFTCTACSLWSVLNTISKFWFINFFSNLSTHHKIENSIENVFNLQGLASIFSSHFLNKSQIDFKT